MEGAQLSTIEPKLFENSGRCRAVAALGLARRFHNETASALGSVGYLVRRVVTIMAQTQGQPPPSSIYLEALPGCLARGFDRPDKLALHDVLIRKGPTCRVAVHNAYAEIKEKVGDLPPDATMAALRRTIAALVRREGLG